MKKRMFIIDALGLIFMYYHSSMYYPLLTKKGENVNAVYDFIDFLLDILDEEDPDYLVVACDAHAKTFRHELYSKYKANRKKTPEDLSPQIDLIRDIVKKINIPLVQVTGYEADDITGTIAKKSESMGLEVACVTIDKDYLQLISKNVKVYKVSRGNEINIYSESKVFNKFGVKVNQLIDYFALMGDSSDNIPGVRGVGEKTAQALISEFGSLENIYKNIEKIEKKSLVQKLESDRELADLSKTLVTIVTNVPIEEEESLFQSKKLNVAALRTILKKLEFKDIEEKLLTLKNKKILQDCEENYEKKFRNEKTINDKDRESEERKRTIKVCGKNISTKKTLLRDLTKEEFDKEEKRLLRAIKKMEEDIANNKELSEDFEKKWFGVVGDSYKEEFKKYISTAIKIEDAIDSLRFPKRGDENVLDEIRCARKRIKDLKDYCKTFEESYSYLKNKTGAERYYELKLKELEDATEEIKFRQSWLDRCKEKLDRCKEKEKSYLEKVKRVKEKNKILSEYCRNFEKKYSILKDNPKLENKYKKELEEYIDAVDSLEFDREEFVRLREELRKLRDNEYTVCDGEDGQVYIMYNVYGNGNNDEDEDND